MTIRSIRNRKSERGNVFFTLFGAVAIVGVLGAGIMATMRGPLSTMVNVNRRTQAEADMAIAAKLILLEAADDLTHNGDCDGDTFVEPMEFLSANPAPTGGGQIPAAIGSSKVDAWGTPYGYCAWDPGTIVDDVGNATADPDACDNDGDTNYRRLAGTGDSDDDYMVIAIVSAGADQEFETTCAGGANPGISKTAGSDDFWVTHTYATAIAATGGLWSLKAGEPGVATIDKDIEAQGATFSGPVDMRAAASMFLPNETVATTCNSANIGIVRVNTTTDPDTLEVCDDAADDGVTGPFTWVNVALGAAAISLWQQNALDTDEIYYDTDNVGIGLTDPTQPLDVSGNARIRDNIMLDAGSSVVWDGAGGDPSITENANGLDIVAGTTQARIRTAGIDLTGNTTITGSGVDATTNALVVSNGTPTSIFVVENDGEVGIGVADPNDKLDVAGSIDVTDHYKLDGVNFLTDNATDETIIVGKGAGTGVTGAGTNNTILGGGAGATLTTGKNNILIGSHDVTAIDVPLATTENYLNIGNLIYGDLANGRVGIGTNTLNDALEVNGNIDASGNIEGTDIHATQDITAARDITATRNISGVDITASGTVHADVYELDGLTNDFSDIPDCDDANDKVIWIAGTGWDCATDLQGGAGGAGQNLEEVLTVGNDADGLTAIDLGGIAIGSGTLTTGGDEDLVLDVTGAAGADFFCDAAGNNCFTASTIASGGTSKLNTITAADGNNTIGSAAWNQTWNWQLTGAEVGFTFGETAASTGGAADQYLLAARTLAASTATPFMITNLGAAASFRVNDETGDADTTPFVITADGKVGVGLAAPASVLDVAASGTNTDFRISRIGNAAAYLSISSIGGANSSSNFTVAGTNVLSLQTDGVAMGSYSGGATDVPANSVIIGSEVGINDATPDDGTGGGGQNLYLDVNGATGSTYFCDENGLNCFTAASVVGTSLWERSGTVIRTRNPAVYLTDDFVFGAAQLADIVGTDDDNRMFFDKSKGAFRAGAALSTQWDDASVGNYSAALGINTIASGNYSTATGASTTASGHVSTTMGTGNYASGDYSTTFGVHASVGDSIVPDGTGNASVAFGLIDSAVTISVPPKVTGIQSMGIFMDDQDGVDITASNLMALLGGRFVIDPDTTSAANTNVSTGVQQLELDVEGDIGAINYCDQAGNNCFTPASVASNRALSAITAATAGNSINNADYAQVWNWNLTTNDKDAFTFTENTASTATGHSSILKAEAIATSTATPLRVTNLGAGDSFVVNDETGDTDTSPFIVKADGKIGIGTDTPAQKLHVMGTSPQLQLGDNATAGGLRFYAGTGTNKTLTMTYDAFDRFVLSPAVANQGYYIGPVSGASDFARAGINVNTMGGGNDSFAIMINGTSAFNMGTTGEFGVGDTTPDDGSGSGGQNLLFDIEGPLGASYYCDQNGLNCFTPSSIASNRALSAITAATADNSINSGNWNQVWNWQLAAGEVGLTIGENIASTGGSADQYILAAKTLAASTATPFMITNLGDAASFRVNDATGDADTTPFVVDEAGEVGIGTATPGVQLQIHQPTGAFPKMRLTAADVTLPSYSGSASIGDVSATNTIGQIRNRMDGGGVQSGGLLVQGFTGSGVNNFYPLHLVGTHGGTAPTTAAVTIGGQKWSGTNNRAALTSTTPILDIENNYATAGSGGLVMRVMGDGKVGIGTAAPSELLDIVGTDATAHIQANGEGGATITTATSASANQNAEITARRSRGTLAAPTVVQDDDAILGLWTDGYDGDSWVTSSLIQTYIDGTPGDGDMPGRIEFQTQADGGGGNPEGTTPEMVIKNDGSVGIGLASPASRFVVAAPSTEVIGAAATITADACGTVKRLSATANRTTDTTDTFTAPTASYAGCCMDVVNVDTVDTITLDNNAKFITGPGADLAVGPGKAVRVCSDGTSWYQASTVTSAAATILAIDDLSDAFTDYAVENNLIMGRAGAAALAAGAQRNVFIGQNAGATTANSTATTDSNTAVGYTSLASLTSGDQNTALGRNALTNNLSGSYNTAMGNQALQQNTTGHGNTSIGSITLYSNVAKRESTAIGYSAMFYADDTAVSSVTYNTAVGAYALQGSTTAANNTGIGNTALGHSALMNNTSGIGNIGIGYAALTNNAGGHNNIGIGYQSMQANTSGQSNIAIGEGAMMTNATRYYNTAVGVRAMMYASSSAGGEWSGNTAFGALALHGSTTAANNTGQYNTAIGYSALTAMTSGSQNTALGLQAGDSITTGSNNILLGFDIDTPANNTSNHLNIGDTIFGDLANDNVRIGGSGVVGAGPFTVAPPSTEVVAAAAVITANACGSIKQLSATANRTTDTTDTFTTPTAAYAGCCMDVVNVDTVDTITLDQNARFLTGPGTDLALGPNQAVRVCSDGTSWYQAASVSSIASGGNIPLSGLTAAIAANSINNADYAQTWNWQVTTNDKDAFTFTENTASTATGHSSILKAATIAASTATPLRVTNLGAGDSFVVNDETGDADTTPFIVKADGKVGIGTTSPNQLLEVSGTTAYISLLSNGEGAVTSSAASANWWENGGFNAARSRGTIAVPTAVQSGDSVLTMWGTAYDGDTWETPALMQYFVDGTPGDGDMPGRIEFQTQADGAAVNPEATTPELVIKNNGYVGLSIAAPSALLHVNNTSAGDSFRVDDANGDTSPFVIDTTGEVGIGIAAPDDLLDIGANTEEGVSLEVSTNTAAHNPFFQSQRSRGTMAAPTVVSSGDVIHEFLFNAYDGTNYEESAYIGVYVDGTPGNDDMPGRIEFNTQPDGSATWLGDGATTPEMVIKNDGAVGIGIASPASKFVVASPTAEVVGAAAVITANSCGTVKRISATANRTTDTTDTFTTPTASYAGCCMDVINIDTVDTITLDQNARFFTGSGGDLSLGPGFGVRVCSDGTSWYQAGGVSNATAGSSVLSAITAAAGANSINNGDHAQTWNWALTTADKDAFTFTENAASTATGHSSVLKAATLAASTATPLIVTNLGASNSFRVNDETGDADASPFIIDETGRVGIGTATPDAGAKLDVHGPVFVDGDSTGNPGDIFIGGGGWPYNIGVGWSGYSQLYINAVGTGGGTADFRDLGIMNGKSNMIAFYQGSTKRFSVGGDDTTPDAMLEVIKDAASPLMMLSSAAANNGDLMIVDTNGNVGIGTASPTDLLHVAKDQNGSTAIRLSNATAGASAEAQYEVVTDVGNLYMGMNSSTYSTNPGDTYLINQANTDMRFATNNTYRMIIEAGGDVGIGNTSPASLFVVGSPTAEVVGAAATITANSCGTVKQISATANRTTNTTDTFTTPTASYNGCCMDVVNVDTVDTITLDQNANFFTGPGTDLALAPGQGVRVCSDGTDWYQAGGVSSATAGGGGTIDGLTDAYADYTTLNNIIMGRASAAALTAGAQYNLFIGENAGATSANSTANTDWNVALGHYALPALTSGHYNTALGALTLQANTSGSDNVAVGTLALNTNVTKIQSTAVGYRAMEFADSAAGGAVTYNTAIGAFALQGSAAAASNTGTNNTALGHSALTAMTSGGSNVAVGALTGDTLTTGGTNILIGYNIDTPANNTSNHLNIGGTIFGNVSTDNVRIGGSGTVDVGPFVATAPAAEAIAGAATITANACGTIKQINSTGNQTTNTTNTFTAPTGYGGCCMDVVNVDTVDTITLDANALFLTGPGTDVALAPGKGVRVCSDGTNWYQAGGVSSLTSASTALSGVTAAAGDATIANAANNIVWNWQLSGAETGMVFGETAASAGGTTGASGDQFIAKASTLATSTATPFIVTNLGAANSFRVNDETGDTDATPFVIAADGKVGVGTSSPSQLLEVYGTTASISLLSNGEGAVTSSAASANWWENGGFNASRSRGTIAAPTVVQSGDSVLTMWGTAYDSNSWETPALMQFFVDGTPGNGDMPGRIEFQTQADGAAVNPEATTPEMVIKSTGFVGIGTGTPGHLLSVASDTENGFGIKMSNAAGGMNPYIMTERSRGTNASPTIVSSGDVITEHLYRAYDGGAYEDAAYIGVYVDGTPGASDMPGRIEFNTQPDGSGAWMGDGNTTSEMVIKSTGFVGIGIDAPTDLLHVSRNQNGSTSMRLSNTTAGASAEAQYEIQTDVGTVFMGMNSSTYASNAGDAYLINTANTDLRFATNNTYRMKIQADGDIGINNDSPNVELDVVGDIEYTGTITDVSDIRLKTNIHPLKDRGSMLEKLGRVDTYSFTMKDDEKGQVEFGVMAQEIEKIFPELVRTADDEMGTKSVNYSGLIAPMIEAGKELEAQNKALKAEIDALKAQQDEMKQAMNDIAEDMKGMKVHTGYGIGKAEMSLLMILAALGTLGAAGLARRRFGKPRQ